MDFLDELVDKVKSVLGDDIDHEAIAAARAAEEKAQAAQRLTDEGFAVGLRLHGPYPRHPGKEQCADWIASGHVHCAVFDEKCRCAFDHKPLEGFEVGDTGTASFVRLTTE